MEPPVLLGLPEELVLNTLGGANWVIVGVETGEEEATPHYQVALQYPRKKSFGSVKKALGALFQCGDKAHVEKMHGTVEQSKEYCSKEGHAKEWGTAVESQQGKRTDLENLRAAIVEAGALGPLLLTSEGGQLDTLARHLPFTRAVLQNLPPAVPPFEEAELSGSMLTLYGQVMSWLMSTRKTALKRRTILFLSGPHGSGKSTILDCLGRSLGGPDTTWPEGTLAVSGTESLSDLYNLYQTGMAVLVDIPKGATHKMKGDSGGEGSTSTGPPPSKRARTIDSFVERISVDPTLRTNIEEMSNPKLVVSTKYEGGRKYWNSPLVVATNLAANEIRQFWPNRGDIIELVGTGAEMKWNLYV